MNKATNTTFSQQTYVEIINSKLCCEIVVGVVIYFLQALLNQDPFMYYGNEPSSGHLNVII